MNLLTNSLKFTLNGSISVVVTFKSSGQLLEFRVADTGIGITKKD